jgi:hypothetical protein
MKTVRYSKERALGFDVPFLFGRAQIGRKAKSGIKVGEPVLCEKRQIRAELPGKPST